MTAARLGAVVLALGSLLGCAGRERADPPDPCTGKACGEDCVIPCPPGRVCPADTAYCHADGRCRSEKPSCPGCEDVQCVRPYECVLSCDGPVLYVGCCPCAPPMFDRLECQD